MRQNRSSAVLFASVTALTLGSLLFLPRAGAQKPRDEAAAWEYKVGIISYNPGERLTDERRAALLEKTLNEQSRQGWEFAGTLMSRDTVQTVGGAVTTRDTTSFLAYRRRR